MQEMQLQCGGESKMIIKTRKATYTPSIAYIDKKLRSRVWLANLLYFVILDHWETKEFERGFSFFCVCLHQSGQTTPPSGRRCHTVCHGHCILFGNLPKPEICIQHRKNVLPVSGNKCWRHRVADQSCW